ncbi:MAG: LPXTG cell wall anchor domain-containing protein [Acidipila sp.]|nr:LPXTG cell wall anchor domain-containing protein [Acidipila sp.]
MTQKSFHDDCEELKMMRFKMLTVLLYCAAMALVMPSRAKADEHDKKTIVTFSEPFEVPGVGSQVLPAGTYQFKLLESPSDRNIVQILNEDGTKIFTTILAIPNYRLKPTDKTVIMFGETPAGTAPAIRAWFYPGHEYGQEFVYPKERAQQLAKLTNSSVPSSSAAVSSESSALSQEPVAAVRPSGEEYPLNEYAQAAPAKTEVMEAPRPVETQQAPAPVEPAPVARTLPQTASQTPLFGLIGLLSLGVSITLLVVSKRAV